MNHNGGALGVNPPEAKRWQRLLREAVRDPRELCALLGLPDDVAARAEAATRAFPLLVPRGFIARMRHGDVDDPLLRQVLPLGAELEDVPGWVADPLVERDCAPRPGLLHKYHGRALLVTTGACAVHCRYCFRRHFPYDEVPVGRERWRAAIDYISGDATIDEAILSGGDPLTLADEMLAPLARELALIPHLRRLRIHSRLPVVLPERIDDALLDWFTGTRLAPVLVLHANHPHEVDDAVAAACARARARGVVLLNQSVLLRGVNDDVDSLSELSHRLFAAGVQPYYLHALDRVSGAAHFAVDDARAKDLMRGLAARLPGYLLPRWVREVPGESGKVALAWR
ncbi:MAG TPA: EF-P beta-lysylation protein EpmB [Planctomycetota bacterium]|nr:EF-P beta-lysylation protein EpmB [Planctomycetota bacterium]